MSCQSVLFSAWRYGLECRHVLAHRHRLRAGQLFHQGISFLVIAVCVGPEQDLDVRELKSNCSTDFSIVCTFRSYVLLIRILPCDVTMRNELRVLVPT